MEENNIDNKRIKLIFKQDLNTGTLNSITTGLIRLDAFYEIYFEKNKDFFSTTRGLKYKTEIIKVERGSTFIELINQLDWENILLFVLSCRGDIIGTFKDTFKNAEKFIDFLEERIKRYGVSIKENQKKQFLEIVHWYYLLSENERIIINRRIKNIYNHLKPLRNIVF